MELTATTTVNKPPEEVYGFWNRLENLATFMAHLDDVRVTGPTSSHWSASAPFDTVVEWNVVTTGDVTAERIAWASVAGADVDTSGEVLLVPAPGGRGTEVHVTLRFDTPAGALGRAVAKYFGEDPSQALDDDLRRFKQVMETGEVVRSEGALWGKRARKEFPQRPARPLSDQELQELRGRKEVLA
jgi:uncharacterized membrane protein